MKDMKILLVFFNVLFILSLVKSANVTQTYLQERNCGIWSNFQQAENINTAPASYFVCKVGLRESKWQKKIKNCNCRRNPSRARNAPNYICDWCPNYFMSMVDAVKVTYCNKFNWEKQIQKIFETGKMPTGKYRDVVCPKNTYVNKFSVRFGYQLDVDIGLVGLQLKCTTSDLKVSSILQNNYNFGQKFSSNNSENHFVSSISFKYEDKGKLTGINVGYEKIIQVQISSIKIKYDNIDTMQLTQTVVQTVSIKNFENNTKMIPACFKNNFIKSNKLQTNVTQILGYNVSINATTDIFPFMSKDGKPSADSIYKVRLQNFAFNQNVKTVFEPIKQLMVLVPAKKQLQIKSIIRQQNVKVPFQANLTLTDRFSGTFLGYKVINGVWKGALTFPPEIQIFEIDLSEQKTSHLVRQQPFN